MVYAPTWLDCHSRSSSSSSQPNDDAALDSAWMMTAGGSRSSNSTASGLPSETLPPSNSTSSPRPNVVEVPLWAKTSVAFTASTSGPLARMNGVRETTKQSPARRSVAGMPCTRSQHSPRLTTLNFNSMGRKRSAQMPPACKRTEQAARSPAKASTSDNGSEAAFWMITTENRIYLAVSSRQFREESSYPIPMQGTTH